jgi:3-dehydroquinate dehydratase II
MKNILVLHGVNLNMFGKRDPSQYGTVTLDEINRCIKELGSEIGCAVETFQTNHEGEMCERIQKAHTEKVDALVINAGAWTHYSYALRDALEILSVPIVEVHMSRTYAREEFRSFSVFSSLTSGVIAGFGIQSYLLGLRAAWGLIQENPENSDVG